jgi:hypothetical protein
MACYGRECLCVKVQEVHGQQDSLNRKAFRQYIPNTYARGLPAKNLIRDKFTSAGDCVNLRGGI